jgi:hypothetical protein
VFHNYDVILPYPTLHHSHHVDSWQCRCRLNVFWLRNIAKSHMVPRDVRNAHLIEHGPFTSLLESCFITQYHL